MSNDDVKEIIIETAQRKRRIVPKVLIVPELPLGAPDFDAYLNQLDQPQPSKSNATEHNAAATLPGTADDPGRDDPVGG
jgi:hypothetical protein